MTSPISSSNPYNNATNVESNITRLDKHEEQLIQKAKQLLLEGNNISYVAQTTGLTLETIMRLQQKGTL